MPDPGRAATRALAALVAAGFALGTGAATPVRAQTDAESALIRQFGGYELTARGNGLLVTYDPVGVFPVPPPVGQVGLPEAQATLTNAPGGYALSSLAWPGPLLADLGTAVAQDPACAQPFPPYPIRAEAFYPSDRTEQREEIVPGSELVSLAGAVGSEGFAQYSGAAVPGLVSVGAINVRSRTEVVDGEVVSRLRSELSGISILGGIIRIDGVVTDLVANSNSEGAASGGETVVSGVTVLGQAATVDADGITMGPAPEPPPGPLDPILDPVLDPIGDGLGEVTEPVGEAVAPVNDLVEQILGGQGTIDELLEMAGIEFRLLDPVETIGEAAATRVGNGLAVTMTYDGATTPVLSDLLAQVADQLPSDPLFPCSPFSAQGLLYMLRETHVTTFSLASGMVAATATPAFVFTPAPRPTTPAASGAVVAPRPVAAVPGFTTPAPSLAAAPGGAAVEAEPIALFGQAIPAILLILLILGSPLFGAASARLADNVLAPVASGCPDRKQRLDRGGP